MHQRPKPLFTTIVYLAIQVACFDALFDCITNMIGGRALDSRPKGRGFEPHRRHCVVSLSKNINPSLVLVQPRKTRPFITERLLMERKESNQENKKTNMIGCLFNLQIVKSTPNNQTWKIRCFFIFILTLTSHFTFSHVFIL